MTVMQRDGQYAAWFRTPRGEGTGIVQLDNGRISGGDAMFTYGGSYQLDEDRFTAVLTTHRYADGPFTTVFGCDEVEAQLTGSFSGNRAVCMGTAKQAPGVVFEATLFLQQPEAAPTPPPKSAPGSAGLARLPKPAVSRRSPNPFAGTRIV